MVYFITNQAFVCVCVCVCVCAHVQVNVCIVSVWVCVSECVSVQVSASVCMIVIVFCFSQVGSGLCIVRLGTRSSGCVMKAASLAAVLSWHLTLTAISMATHTATEQLPPMDTQSMSQSSSKKYKCGTHNASCSSPWKLSWRESGREVNLGPPNAWNFK